MNGIQPPVVSTPGSTMHVQNHWQWMIGISVAIFITARRQSVIADQIQAVSRFYDGRNHFSQTLTIQLIPIREEEDGLTDISVVSIVVRWTFVYGECDDPLRIIQAPADYHHVPMLDTMKIVQISGNCTV